MISSTSFKLDNISITNKDNEPLTKVVSFKTNKLDIPADFPYVETWNDDDLIKSNWDGISQVKGDNGLILWLGIGLGIVIVGTVLTVVLIKKKGKAK